MDRTNQVGKSIAMGGKTAYDSKMRSKVEVRLTGRQTERFIKLCGMNGIELRRLSREENGKGYRFVIWAEDFFALRHYLKKTKCRARIVSREGAAFFVKRNHKRWLFPAGLLSALIVLIGLSQFVWKIDIEGNVYYTDDLIYRFLEEQKVMFGTPKAAIYTAGLEEALRDQFKEVTWVSVQLEGTQLSVSLREDDQKEAMLQSTQDAHIVSTRDGVITSLVVRSGVTALKEGDTVVPGQILISGEVPLKDDGGNVIGTKSVRADGEIYANVSYGYEDSFLLSHEIREYAEDPVRRYALVIGNTRIALPQVGSVGDRYDVVSQRKQLYLGSNYYLPIYLEIKEYRGYESRVTDYTDEEAKSVAAERFERYLRNKEAEGHRITAQEWELQITSGVCYVSGSYSAVSQIGVCQTIGEKEAEQSLPQVDE